MAKGDHLYYSFFFNGFPITHHGIDCGNALVIEFGKKQGSKDKCIVTITTLNDFYANRKVSVKPYGKCDCANIVIDRARKMLGQENYNLFTNNCEHLATYCKTGIKHSEQVKNVKAVGSGASASGVAVATGIGVVAGTGAAAGFSGAGIMSGLATVGGVVGGGAVAGVGVLGAAPAAIAKVAMDQVLKDDETLPPKEREARKRGRDITTVGAVAGTAGAVGAIAASGSVAGLSAAGITSGLAAVGSVIGGGMVAGVAVTVAAPAVTAGAIGFGAYKIWKWLSE
ncbi:lecithin retinol acyltransferase family protein [Geminocystis sp.]|uniref:lecithin retinol acyltransferase family protein n=1 Tax=Geminocystis sp. TaxID=2664100 RepID=UPI00359461D0